MHTTVNGACAGHVALMVVHGSVTCLCVCLCPFVLYTGDLNRQL